MDSQRFDRFTRSLAGGLSRRALVAGVTGGFLTALVGRGATEASTPRPPNRLRPPVRCKGQYTTPCGGGCCSPGYVCLQETGCAPDGSISCGNGYCSESAGCCDGLCAHCDCAEGTIECGNTCVDNRCESDEFFDANACQCAPKKEVGESCSSQDAAGNAECLSDVCGCNGSLCVCRNSDCVGTGEDCSTTGSFGCCQGVCTAFGDICIV